MPTSNRGLVLDPKKGDSCSTKMVPFIGYFKLKKYFFWRPIFSRNLDIRTGWKKTANINENQWKSMNIYENQWKLIKNQWKSMTINENQWKSMKMLTTLIMMIGVLFWTPKRELDSCSSKMVPFISYFKWKKYFFWRPIFSRNLDIRTDSTKTTEINENQWK